ncbi:hypothetical protein [Picosynechococcus sp. PCC 7003]|uniref:hypothetical protein n=1 Tax=Picosynechococcus sp. PCC 7003 TaxID=374981 RepID=UPI0012ED7205|nr:hypothetical protein [Picosynechococcus sp. PCC 7003]
MTILIASFWAALKTLLTFWEKWQTVAKSPQQITAELEKVESQLETMWRKFDDLAALTDTRLDSLERKLSYLAGTIRIQIENLEGHRD